MKRAFTLIELLIVIAIIAILALIAIPNFIEAQTRAKISRAESDMRSIATALEAYFVDNNSYPISPLITSINRPQAHKFWFLIRSNNTPNTGFNRAHGLFLTTPIAYITTFPLDPFGAGIYTEQGINDEYRSYFFVNFLSASKREQFLSSGSPPPLTDVHAPVYAKFAPVDDARTHKMFWLLVSTGPARTTDIGMGNKMLGQNGIRFTNILNSQEHFNEVEEGYMLVPYDPTNGTVSHGGILRADSPLGK